ncbi:MAG TPA: shikimate dehydrogenase [Thermoplasmata archaeon]|nr:shikimate dehydrogenase [Thermoplasmata archaeon]
MTKVAAVIAASDMRSAERDAKQALSQGADLVELRLDSVRDVSPGGLRALASSVGRHAIATVRSKAEGGAGAVPDERRTAILADLAKLPFAYLDLERRADGARAGGIRGKEGRGPVRIVSEHFSASADLAKVEDALEACGALGEVAKVAVPVDDIEEAIALVDLARSHRKGPRRAVVIGMGLAGMLTRVLAEDTGQEIQYAAFGPPSVPGQLPLPAAVRLKGRHPIVLGLVGHPLGHSISPQIHEAALASANIPGVYLLFDVGADTLRRMVDEPDRIRLRGFNVTIPYKEAVADLVDDVDGDAEALGAVNTVVVADGWTKGHNTDVHGFRIALRSLGIRLGQRKALVVGAGGAAKAVVHVLLREGAAVTVANRTPSRAEALARGFDESVEVADPDELESRGPWDLLVNATPVGTKGLAPGVPVPDATIRRSKFVFDLVYNPPETPLLASARRAGVPAASGLTMLVHQAAKAYELWIGLSPDMKAMETAAREALR